MKPSAFEIVLEIVGVTFIACAVMAAISLMTYDPVDPSINSYLTNMQAVHNKAGIIGAGIADTLVQSFGASAWILTLGSLYLGVTLCFKPMVGGMSIFTAGLALMVAMVSAGLGLRGPVDPLFSNIASGGAMAAANWAVSLVSRHSRSAPSFRFRRAPKPVHSCPEYGAAKRTVGRPTLRTSLRIGTMPMER